MPRRTEPRLLADAASVVPGARRRYLRAPIGHCSGRDEAAQLHSSGRVSLHNTKWLRLRFRQLSQDVAGGEGADWLGGLEEEAGRSASGGMLGGDRDRHYPGFRHEQFWAVANRESPCPIFREFSGHKLQPGYLLRRWLFCPLLSPKPRA